MVQFSEGFFLVSFISVVSIKVDINLGRQLSVVGYYIVSYTEKGRI